MTISYHRNFTKKFIKLSPRQKKKFQERQVLFEIDEFNPILNNHALTGEYKGYRSINVTGDIRVVFKREDDTVVFVKIDSHSNLYR